MWRSTISILLIPVLTVVVSHQQDVYPDYSEQSFVGDQNTIPDDVSHHNTISGSFWNSSSSIQWLAPTFKDKSLIQNCTPGARIVCTGCRRFRVCLDLPFDQSMFPESTCPEGTRCNNVINGGECNNAAPEFPECDDRPMGPNGGGEDNRAGMLCTGTGVFPDAEDCRKFHHCTTVGANSRPLQCPSKYVYNAQKKTCSRSAQCRKIQCRSRGGSSFVPYQPDPRYYAYCNYDRNGNRPVLRSVLMYKCPYGSEFNSRVNACVFKCSREGFFAKPGNPSKYYWCRKVQGTLFGYEQACHGTGSVFSPRLGICLPPPPLPPTTTTTPPPPPPTTPTLPPTTPMTTTSATTTGSSMAQETTPAATTEAIIADFPIQLPPWPQWPSIPVSSLL